MQRNRKEKINNKEKKKIQTEEHRVSTAAALQSLPWMGKVQNYAEDGIK